MLQLPAILSGCKVFPCIAGTKHPATEKGWHEASSDPAQIAEWERSFPGCNWAVATGPSGLFVFDADPNGLATWEKLKADNPALAEAYTVRTPRGGFHAYFRGEGPSTASRIAEGIDTRGGFMRDGKLVSGGYVLLPGSRTADGTYSEIGGALVQMPAAITAIIPERKHSETHGLEKSPDKDQPRNVAWAVDLLTGYVQNGRVSVQGKGGNNLAFQVAASILDKAISPATCYELLVEHWNEHCQPPWDDWELERIVSNAANYGEDTGAGVKGFQANADAFAGFEGQEFAEPAKPARERDKLMWLHDYADTVEDPVWLVPGFLPAQGTGMLYGASGSYKSFLALDMALCVAYGNAGQWGAPPVKNDVLFLAGEGPIGTAKKRWPAWMEWQGIELRNDHRFIMKNRVPFLSDIEAWEHIKLDLAELGSKPSLIIIDTLTRLLVGMDENSANDATKATTFLEQLAHYFECFVLVIHHTGKEEKKGARGSSAFFSNLDVMLSTQKKQDGTELRVRKQKDADVPDNPFYFQMKEVGPSIVLERIDALAEPAKAGKTRRDWASKEEVVKVLAPHGELGTAMLVQLISDATSVEPATVRRKLLNATDLQWLRRDQHTWAIPVAEYDL